MTARSCQSGSYGSIRAGDRFGMQPSCPCRPSADSGSRWTIRSNSCKKQKKPTTKTTKTPTTTKTTKTEIRSSKSPTSPSPISEAPHQEERENPPILQRQLDDLKARRNGPKPSPQRIAKGSRPSAASQVQQAVLTAPAPAAPPPVTGSLPRS